MIALLRRECAYRVENAEPGDGPRHVHHVAASFVCARAYAVGYVGSGCPLPLGLRIVGVADAAEPETLWTYAPDDQAFAAEVACWLPLGTPLDPAWI